MPRNGSLAVQTPQNEVRVAQLTHIIVKLEEACERFSGEVANSQAIIDTIATEDALTDEALIDESIPDTVGLIDTMGSVQSRLHRLKDNLSSLKAQLLDHPTWHQPSTPPAPVDITDLGLNIIIPAKPATLPSSSSTPTEHLFRTFFESYTWKWDPVWKELYTSDPPNLVFIYLSRWRMNPVSMQWEHMSMARGNYTPDAALQALSQWDKWRWDSIWREWYLDAEGDGLGCWLYASPWQVWNGRWAYVGRVGGGVIQPPPQTQVQAQAQAQG